MTPYTDVITSWPGNVTLVDTTDLVQGGVSGTSNVATKQLANRSGYLYDLRGRFENAITITNSSSTSVTGTISDIYRNIVYLSQAVDNYLTYTLPDVSTLSSNSVAVIKRSVTGFSTKPVTIDAYAGQKFIDRYNNNLTSIYLHNNECVELVKVNATTWYILSFDGNFYNVGDQFFGYSQKPGTLIREGQLISRADYPRLWAFANSVPGLIVTDFSWIHNVAGTFFTSRGFFSSGDGSTTFRLPDDRGYFDRALSMGSGNDADREAADADTTVGSRQLSQIGAHNHQDDYRIGSGSLVGKSGTNAGGSEITDTTQNAGGSETRPINVGKLPLIIY